MKRFLTIFILLPLLSFSQTWHWTKSRGGLSDDYGRSICTDGLGNCYTSVDSSGQIMILKCDSSGNFIWSKNTWVGKARTLVYDNSGHLYLAGDSIGFTVVAKYDTSGNMIWKIDGGISFCHGMNLDNFGNFYLAGVQTFLQRFDTSGNQIWIRNVPAISNSVCTDNFGNCYITGYFSDTTFFGADTIIPIGRQDLFIAKYDSLGNNLWVKQAGGNSIDSYSNDIGYAIVADNSGNIYLTGCVADTAYFETTILNGNRNDIFLAKYDDNGNLLWVRQASGPIDEEGRCIAIDINGDVLIGGSYVPNINFGSYQLTGWGNYDAFVAKYDSGGNFINVIKAGESTWNEFVSGISIDQLGNIFVVGIFYDTAFFGVDTLNGMGNFDIFISKIDFQTQVNEIEINSSYVNITPNPSNGFFSLDIDNRVIVHEIRIYDITGKLVVQLPPKNQNNFDLQKFQSGTYNLSVIDNNNRIINKKIVSFHN